jgi:predicted ester cyclase
MDILCEDVLPEWDESVGRLRARATHRGAGLGVPPNGRAATFTVIVWLRWRDGQVVEAWNEFDDSGLLAQIIGPPAGVAAVRPR